MTSRRLVGAVLGVALLLRLLEVVSEFAFVHPDALYQGLEPAFDLVWGAGRLPWEFRDGLRSWAWPGLLAAPMALGHALGTTGPGLGMAGAVAGARCLVVAIDLIGIVVAMRIAWRVGSFESGLAVGALMAVHPVFVVMGAQPLIDGLASVLLLVGVERVLARPVTVRAGIGLGVALGVLVFVRPQLLLAAMLLVAVAVVQAPARGRWGLAGGLAVAAACFGLLDALTWGAPWASSLAYVRFNLSPSRAPFGSMPLDRYWVHAGQAWGPLRAGLVLLAVAGARRSWLLAAVLCAIVIPHQLIELRVWRFLHPAQPWLVLLAVGSVDVHLRRRSSASVRAALGMGFALAVAVSIVAAQRGVWSTTWLYNQGGWAAVERSRGLHWAALVVSAGPVPTGLVQTVLPRVAVPGRALLGHDCPWLDPPQDAAGWSTVSHWIIGPGPTPAGWDVLARDPATDVAVLVRPDASL